MEQTPQSLKIAAVAQLVSGIVTLITPWFVGCGVSTVCGMLSLGLGGQFCGLFVFLLIPLGLVEIGSGIYGILNPREAGSVMRIIGIFEILAVLLGGLSTFIVGGLVTYVLMQEDVKAYLEGPAE